MPDAALPNTWQGWLIVLAASFVGFISGFIVISLLTRMAG